MKKLENPTTFFFKQAENPPDLYRKEIDEFVNKLLDKDNCPLCKLEYNTNDRIPRIMIHCGHSFCTPCLIKFYMYLNFNLGIAESDAPCASNSSNNSTISTVSPSIIPFSLILSRKKGQQRRSKEGNTESKTRLCFCLESFNGCKSRHICSKILKRLTLIQDYHSVCSITIGWNIFTVKHIK